jgi:hypothetical protein
MMQRACLPRRIKHQTIAAPTEKHYALAGDSYEFTGNLTHVTPLARVVTAIDQ